MGSEKEKREAVIREREREKRLQENRFSTPLTSVSWAVKTSLKKELAMRPVREEKRGETVIREEKRFKRREAVIREKRL